MPVLPAGRAGRVRPARHAGHDDGRDVPGGAVDAGEPPAAAAVRKAREQISADVRPVRLADVPGGPGYQVSCPGGDRTAYVIAVYEAPDHHKFPGTPVTASSASSPGFTPGQQPGLQPSRFFRALLHAAGRL